MSKTLFWHSPDCTPIIALSAKPVADQIKTISGKFPIKVEFYSEPISGPEAIKELYLDVIAIYDDGTWQSFFLMFHDDT